MDYVVLVADDEKELLDVLELYLAKENIQLLKAYNGVDALDLFHKQTVHLLLLDVMMPKMDGFTTLREIRKESEVPAIMITAKDTDNDKILGLDLGADDYITKPFNPMEVVARIKAQLRRNYILNPSIQEVESTEKSLIFFDIMIDREKGLIQKGGEDILLTSTEYKILCLLAEHPGRIYTKKQIYEAVWNDYYYEDDSSLLVHMSNLRNKIETTPKKPEILKTIKGLGYKVEQQK